jgi:nucleoid-associated protein YgaU
MATKRNKKNAAKRNTVRPESRAAITRADSRSDGKKPAEDSNDIFKKVSTDLQQNNSVLNLILGALVVIVAVALIFNYFRKTPTNETNISADNTQQVQQPQGDVNKDQLPGQYTVKEGDTLFSIAQSYFNDGYKYPELVKANNMTDENQLEVGQTITIPKLDQTATNPQSSPETSVAPTLNAQNLSPTPASSPTMTAENPSPAPSAPDNQSLGTGGATNQTIWGESITTDTYTVQSGDWLSTIAGRAYGDIYQYQKIAQANNLQNPDLIEPGTVIKIPR